MNNLNWDNWESDLKKSVAEREQFFKGQSHKYFKREGTPGHYKYYYTETEWKEAHGDKVKDKKKISINEETGVFKLNSNEKQVLSRVLIKAFKGKEDKIKNAKFFNSGHKGVSFELNNIGYSLMYDSGHVGLEDQTMGSLILRKGANTLLKISPDYYKRNFGDTNINENHEQIFINEFKKWINKKLDKK